MKYIKLLALVGLASATLLSGYCCSRKKRKRAKKVTMPAMAYYYETMGNQGVAFPTQSSPFGTGGETSR
jgi:hypothetical protein